MDPVDLSSTFIRDLSPTQDDLEAYLPDEVIPLYQSYRARVTA